MQNITGLVNDTLPFPLCGMKSLHREHAVHLTAQRLSDNDAGQGGAPAVVAGLFSL